MTTFRPHPNNVSSTLASDYVPGSGSLVLAAGTGALFGSTFPMMATVITAESYGVPGEVNTIFNATGRNGDTLTVSGPAEGTTDRNYAAGARVECRWTNGLARAIETAVNALETTSVSTSGSYADPAWLTSLAGSKVAGNIAGSAASITGSITTSQINNLSSWPGSTAIVTLGTVSTGTWQGAVISKTYLDATLINTSGSYADPPWITSLAGSKITGNIAGSAASITGSITTSQISNLSSWPGSTAIVTLGTVSTGTWQGAVISKTYLDATLINTSGSYADPAWLTSLAGSKVAGNIAGSAASITGSITTSQISNLSSWPGSTAITQLGTIATGTWQGAVIAPAKLGTGGPAWTNFLRGDGKWYNPFTILNAVSSSYTIVSPYNFIMANASSGALTVTLPDAASSSGMEFVIYKLDASANNVTISRAGTDTFFGGAFTMQLAAQLKFLRLVSSGSQWFVVGSN